MKTNLLELNNIEAQEFFLQNESYFSLELPIYYDFSRILQKVKNKIEGKDLRTFFNADMLPEKIEKVNYHLLKNKDGRYGRRQFDLIHPVLYVALVNLMTEEKNRNEILEKIDYFRQNNLVECLSYPKLNPKKKTDKSEQILRWRKDVEQQSIKLSLEYDYIFHTDITDCYGSIYTHSIPWSLHTKPEAKENTSDELLWNGIDKLIRCMQFWQTNWIPQWSFLMDFIAEIVLGYIDEQLTLRVNNKFDNDVDYKIIRYRDDYRVFTDSLNVWKEIIKELSSVLSELWMRLSDNKTSYSDNIISSSIKADKLARIRSYYGTRNNIKMKKTWTSFLLEKTDSIYEDLLLIREFSETYPNSGTLAKELWNFHEKLGMEPIKQEQIHVMIAIIVDIALNSPRVYNSVTWILSYLIDWLSNDVEKIRVVKKILRKFKKLPNTEYLNIRLQRITCNLNENFEYQWCLCDKMIDSSTLLRDSTRLKWDLLHIINETDFINRKELERMRPIVKSNEISIFEY